MSGKKKSGNEDRTTKYVILITAILNLMRTLIDLVSRLTE